jgi:hypothetical protein
MTTDSLTALLAERVMGWKACPDRFVKAGRAWIPRWRFNPFGCLNDAFLLLERTGGTYLLTIDPDGIFKAEVRVGDRTGKSAGDPKAQAITLAIARALDLETTPVKQMSASSPKGHRR